MDLNNLFSDPVAREILQARAKALAIVPNSASSIEGELTLHFTLGDETYGIPATTAREVIRFTSVASLPGVPPAILGLINVRGRLLTCIDLRPLLGLSFSPPRETMHLLIISAGTIEAALLVDQVLDVRWYSGFLQPTPAMLAGNSVKWVRGMDETLAIHLDPAALLHDPALTIDVDKAKE